MNTMWVYGAFLVIFGLLAACNSEPQTEAQTVTDPAVSAHATHTGAQQKVHVSLTEFKIEMPTTVAAGLTTFTVTNTGSDRHGFEIEGRGIERKMTLEAGQTKTLRVELTPGTYEAYCPVDGHKRLGMSRKLSVS